MNTQSKKFRAAVFYTLNPLTDEMEYNFAPNGARIECELNSHGKLDWFDGESDKYLISGPVVRGKLWSGENMGATVYISIRGMKRDYLMEYGEYGKRVLDAYCKAEVA